MLNDFYSLNCYYDIAIPNGHLFCGFIVLVDRITCIFVRNVGDMSCSLRLLAFNRQYAFTMGQIICNAQRIFVQCGNLTEVFERISAYMHMIFQESLAKIINHSTLDYSQMVLIQVLRKTIMYLM